MSYSNRFEINYFPCVLTTAATLDEFEVDASLGGIDAGTAAVTIGILTLVLSKTAGVLFGGVVDEVGAAFAVVLTGRLESSESNLAVEKSNICSRIRAIVN